MFTEIMLAGLAIPLDTSFFSVGRNCWHNCEQIVATMPYSAPTQNNTEVSKQSLWEYSILGDNLFKLESFRELKQGWNGYNGERISDDVIDNATQLLLKLNFQPKIFPTGRNSIQVEHYFDEENLFELEVFSDKFCIYLINDGEEIEKDLSRRDACGLINKFVNGKL